MFESFFNSIFTPLLSFSPFWTVFLIAFTISLVITVIYKFATDQRLMKELKTDMKKLQKEMKELKDHPEKMMAKQKLAMQKNMEYMKHSMKSTLFTILPIIIIFGWLNGTLGFEPINPGEDFTTEMEFVGGVQGTVRIVAPDGVTIISEEVQEVTDNKASWALNAEEGEYLLLYKFNDQSFEKDVLITSGFGYKQPVKAIKDNVVKSISINQKKLKVMNLFGWKLGWLGTYIIFSIVFSMALRKLMKLH